MLKRINKEFILTVACLVAGVAIIEVMLSMLADAPTDMLHVRWWREVAEVQAENGFFNVWTPYPPLFPSLFYFASRVVSQENLGTLWIAGNFLLLLVQTLLVFVLVWIVTPGFNAKLPAGLLAAVAFLLVMWRHTGLVPLGTRLDHFDYLPTLLMLAGFLLMILRYEKTSALLCGLGVMTKIFPIVLLFAAPAILGPKRSIKYAAIVATTCAVISAPFLFANSAMFASTVRMAFNRPAWESIWAYLMPAVGIRDPIMNVRGILDPEILASPFHMEYVGGLINNIATFVTLPAMLAALAGGAYLLTRSRKPLDAARGLLLLVVIVLMFSKGFSLHFIVWIIPLICIVYPVLIAFAICSVLVLLSNITAAGLIARDAQLHGEVIQQFAFLGPPYFVVWFSIFLRQGILIMIGVQQMDRLLNSREVTE